MARLYFLSKLQHLCSSIDLSLQFLFTLLKTLAFDNRTNRFGLVFKLVVLMCLPIPLLLWPIVGIVGSLLGGIGYGFFAPLLATFQAVGKGENVNQKFHHCFIVSVNFCLCNVSFYSPFGHLTLLVEVSFNSNPFHDRGSDCIKPSAKRIIGISYFSKCNYWDILCAYMRHINKFSNLLELIFFIRLSH